MLFIPFCIMSIIGFLVLFVLWACFGSFGSVLLYRLENFSVHSLRDVVFGRSKDDYTGKVLRRFELIPVVSYIVQKGKSRHTGQALPNDYLRLEIGSWCVFAFTSLLTHTSSLHILIYHLIFNWLLFLLAWYDIKKQFLHTPVRAIALVWQILMWITLIGQSIMASILFGIIFGIIRLFARRYAKVHYKQSEGFGSWDVLLALVIWSTIPHIFWLYGIPFSAQTLAGALVGFLCISSILWLVYAAIAYMISHKKVVFIPFLPAMILAYWILLYQWEMLLRFVLGS